MPRADRTGVVGTIGGISACLRPARHSAANAADLGSASASFTDGRVKENSGRSPVWLDVQRAGGGVRVRRTKTRGGTKKLSITLVSCHNCLRARKIVRTYRKVWMSEDFTTVSKHETGSTGELVVALRVPHTLNQIVLAYNFLSLSGGAGWTWQQRDAAGILQATFTGPQLANDIFTFVPYNLHPQN
jgi:hypothetical protein